MHYALIMAGGAGTRLWPLSRERLPKPALRLYSEQSMFQIAVERLDPLFPPEQILVIAGEEHAQVLAAQVPAIPAANFIVEPQGRGTAPAIGLAAMHLYKRDPQASMAVLTADHHIGKTAAFRGAIAAGLEVAAAGGLVTLGITPTYPSTEYGYIKQAEKLGEWGGFAAFRAERFEEKPHSERAQQMLAQGGYSWNSGMFIWKVSAILEEFERQMPELYTALCQIGDTISTDAYEPTLAEIWPALSKETIDYGVMEGARQVAVIPVDMDWLDVGTWNSLKTLLPGDAQGNHTRGDVLLQDCHDSLIIGQDRLIAVLGTTNLVIVDTPEALLVCDQAHVGEVRALVARLRAEGRLDLI